MGNRKTTKKRISTLGRRTGKDVRAGKRIRVNCDGIERFEDYWTSSDDSSVGNIPSPLCSSPAYFNAPRMSSFIKNIDRTPTKELPEKISFAKTSTFISHAQEKQPNGAVMKHRADRKNLFAVGRRTGTVIFSGKNIRTIDGVDVFDDYFTDSSALTSINGGKISNNRTSSRQNTLSKDKSFNPLNSKCNGEDHNEVSSPHAKSSLCRKSDDKSGQSSFSEANSIQPQISVDNSGDESNEIETFDENIDANEEDVVSGSQSLMPTENGSKLKTKDNKQNTSNEEINTTPLSSKNYNKPLGDNSSPRSGSSLREKSAVKSGQDNSSRSNDIQLKIMDFTETNVPGPVTASPSQKNVNEVESSENQLRRSRRAKFPPLESWRNQRLRINYENGDIASVEVEEGSKPDNSALDKILKRQAYLKKNKKDKKMSKKEKLQNNSINLKQIKKEINKAEVLDPRTGQEELVYLHRAYDTLLWTVPPIQDKNDASYTITKCFSGELISFGYIEIGIGRKKNEQHSPEYNIAFNVVKGNSIKIRIHKTTFILKELDYVVVPAGNAYSMHNRGRSVALLSFSTFKAPMFDYQFLEEQMED